MCSNHSRAITAQPKRTSSTETWARCCLQAKMRQPRHPIPRSMMPWYGMQTSPLVLPHLVTHRPNTPGALTKCGSLTSTWGAAGKGPQRSCAASSQQLPCQPQAAHPYQQQHLASTQASKRWPAHLLGLPAAQAPWQRLTGRKLGRALLGRRAQPSWACSQSGCHCHPPGLQPPVAILGRRAQPSWACSRSGCHCHPPGLQPTPVAQPGL